MMSMCKDQQKLTVSVVVTCYNYGQYLASAMDSALGQTLPPDEIVVVDDGSTDDTPQIMKPYADPRVRYIRQVNAGQPKAKNRGVEEARGDLVAFLDADDIWLPEKLERQLPLFANPEVGVVYSRRLWMTHEGKDRTGNERSLYRGRVLNNLFIDNFICFSSSVVRRQLFIDADGFDENLPMGIDYDLWIRLAARVQFDYANLPLVRYRTGHANLSRNVWKRFDYARQIMEKSLSDPVVRNQLSTYTRQYAWAHTWANMGYLAREQGDARKARQFYLRSLFALPWYLPAWKGLARSAIMTATLT